MAVCLPSPEIIPIFFVSSTTTTTIYTWFSLSSVCLMVCLSSPTVCLYFLLLPSNQLTLDTPCLFSPIVSPCLTACPLLLVACQFYSCAVAWAFCLSSPIVSSCLTVLCYSFPVGFIHVLLLELSDCPLSWNLNEFCLSCPVISCLSPCSFLLSALHEYVYDLMIWIKQLGVW